MRQLLHCVCHASPNTLLTVLFKWDQIQHYFWSLRKILPTCFFFFYFSLQFLKSAANCSSFSTSDSRCILLWCTRNSPWFPRLHKNLIWDFLRRCYIIQKSPAQSKLRGFTVLGPYVLLLIARNPNNFGFLFFQDSRIILRLQNYIGISSNKLNLAL